MDFEAVKGSCSSLLVFCSIAFALMTTLPRLRAHLKNQFDVALSKTGRDMPYRDFFYYSFYLEATKAFDTLSFVYLLAALVVLLHPVTLGLALAGYSLVLCATTAIAMWLAVLGIRTHRTAVANARVGVGGTPNDTNRQP